MPLPSHLFRSADGALFDTRAEGWSRVPLRDKYEYHHNRIDTVAELKATLRAGAYAWPGGYPLYFICDDGAALSFDSVKENLPQVIYAIRHGLRDGWRVVACEINWEDNDLTCEHSGKPIPAAYGAEEE
jgi:hypothetical protein